MKWHLMIPATLASLSLVACGSAGDTSSGGERNDELRPASFSAVPSSTSLAIQVAADQGFFEAEGIEAEILTFASGAAAEQAMVTGEVDFGAGSVGSSILQEAAGHHTVNVALFQKRPIFTLVVRSDLAGEIKTVEDLRGRQIGISSPGSSTDFFARMVLQDAGLDPDSDVSLVATKGPDGHVAALQAEQVDAQLTWEPGTSKIVDELGLGQILVDLRTDDAPESVQALVGSSLQALKTKVEEDPELTEDVARAITAADRAIASDPAILEESISKLFPDLSEDLVTQMAEIEHQSFDPSLTEEDVQAWVDAYLQLGFLDDPVDPASVFDDRFVEIWEEG